MALTTRPPIGLPAWPLILVEGEEKAGKSTEALQLSASPLVGRTFVWDLGDGVADEYAALGPYEIVETNGTFSNLRDTVAEATALAPTDGKPNVYVIDSGTDLWGLLKRWTDHRARQSRAGRAALAQDPDAEIDPSTNLWNDAKDRWAEIVNMLRRAPGIGVITAQGGEVMAFENGQPQAGRTTWSIQAEKTISAACTAWVRVKRNPRSSTLIGVRRIGLEIPDGGLALPLEHTLHHLVFDIIGAGTQFQVPQAAPPQLGFSVGAAKSRVLGAVRANMPRLNEEEAKAEASRVWAASPLAQLGKDQEVTGEQLADVITSVVSAAQEPQVAPSGPETPDSPPEAPEAASGEQGPQPEPISAEELTTEFHGDDTVVTGSFEGGDGDSTGSMEEPEPDPAEQARLAHLQAQRDRIAQAGQPAEPQAAPDDALELLSPVDITAMRKPALVAALAARGLSTHGTVAVMVERLTEHEAARYPAATSPT